MGGKPIEKAGGVKFIDDSSSVITTLDANFSSSGLSYTATEDCWVGYRLKVSANESRAQQLKIGTYEVAILNINTPDGGQIGGTIPLKKGQTLSTRTGYTTMSAVFTVYKMID